MKKIRVLVIDDSAVAREVLRKGLNQDPDIEVVAVAMDPYIAREKIAKFRPDVLTLDVEMPRMSGVQFLRYLMPQFPLPVIIVSALTGKGGHLTMEALEAGAIDFVTKPGSEAGKNLEDVLEEIRKKVKMASGVDVSHWKKLSAKIDSISPASISKNIIFNKNKIVAIGASTGGVDAISKILSNLPANIPGIIIVQHMPPGFTKSYADRLNSKCAMEVREARHGDKIVPGLVLLAPGNLQMSVRRLGSMYQVICEEAPKVKGHCPSVEVLFQSVAKYVGDQAVGLMLTGMGSDGAEGMLAMRNAGARTLGQDKYSSVVFGMPKEAYRLGAIEKLVPLSQIPDELIKLLQRSKS